MSTNDELQKRIAEQIEFALSKTPEALATENAKLRERIHELEMEGSDHFYRTAYAEDANCTLEAENTKLRELLLDIAYMLGKNINLSELCEESANLRAENARLRKLLLDVWNDAMQFDCFWDYVHDDGEIYNEDELPHYYDRMRELGIEAG